MSSFVLVHGAFHAAWCWDRVVPLLTDAGHRVIAPDLPGHGQDDTPLEQVTFDRYCAQVRDIIEEQQEPVILVGHSMGGRVVSRLAEECTNRISTAVYLAALLLADGENSVPPDPDTGTTLIDRSVMVSDDGVSQTLRPEVIRELFFHDCSDEDAAWAMALLEKRQSVQPMTVPMRLTEENFGRVRKVYIECLQDRAVTPGQQRVMYEAAKCDQVISIDRSHSPFLSAPQELAEHLVSIA